MAFVCEAIPHVQARVAKGNGLSTKTLTENSLTWLFLANHEQEKEVVSGVYSSFLMSILKAKTVRFHFNIHMAKLFVKQLLPLTFNRKLKILPVK